MTYDMT